jgi:hypothetical protein
VTWWLWVIAGIAGFVALSIVIALALAAVLGQLGSDVSELFENDFWTDAPCREERESEEARADEAADPRPERVGAAGWRNRLHIRS